MLNLTLQIFKSQKDLSGNLFETPDGASCIHIPESCCAGLGDGFGQCGGNLVEKPHLEGCFDAVGKSFTKSTATIGSLLELS